MVKTFLKKYGYYVLAFSLILIVGVTAGLMSTGESYVPPVKEDSTPTTSTPVEMVCPMESPEVLKWYSDTELFYNSTLKQWESHKAVDLASSSSNDVKAALNGVVTDCSYSYENGYCITITHDDGLATVYCSLANTDSVKKGDTVARGQKIGEVSNSASNESEMGNHLHFQVQLNGKNVDPANYLTLDNK